MATVTLVATAVVSDKLTTSGEEKPRGNGTKYTDETHPYLKPEFWLDPKNQFWKKAPNLYKQESYNRLLEQCEKDLRVKEDLIR